MAFFQIASPDHGATLNLEPRVRTTSFGDGYNQEVPDGINDLVEKWDVSFSNRQKSIIDSIDTFFRENRGVAFDWSNPDGVIIKVKCRAWSKTVNHSMDSSMTATFVQDFEP